MACKKFHQMNAVAAPAPVTENASVPVVSKEGTRPVEQLMFGVDAAIEANDVLQNNLTHFEWAVRNKRYPDFWGRYLSGENALTREEIDFLHHQGCLIAGMYRSDAPKTTEEQGTALADEICAIAKELRVRAGAAIYLELAENENATRNFMRGFAKGMLAAGYTPGFKANTDSLYSFDREFSRGMQTDKEVFAQCLIWAVAPSLAEYDRVTTTHLIHPDNWVPFAPSGITRKDIAIWQYGKNCHPIYDDADKETTFNVNLVRNENVIIEKMF